MAFEWEQQSLADLYEFSSGLSKPRSAFGTGYPFLSFKDVFYNSAVPTRLTELVNSTEQERVRGSVRRGDVFLTRTSETMDELGMSCVALADIKDATFNGFTKRLRPRVPNRVAPEFARYYFRSPTFRQDIYSMSSLSTRASLNNEMLERLTITFPTYNAQRVIGNTLGALDERIDSLRQTNATLEAIVQALFKSWFVDFDPVRAKAEGREPEGMDAVTAALFPSEFEDSELGPIPMGWRCVRFGDVATQSKGSINPGARPEQKFEHYSLPAFDAGQLPLSEGGEAIKSNKTPVPSGAVLVSKLNPHIPRIWFVGDVAENSVCSTEFLVWAPKPGIGSTFVYCLASSLAFNSVMRQLVTGTSNSHQRVKPDQLAEVQVAAISDSSAVAFESIAAPLLRQVERNRQRAATLAQLRDTLLPRLISGKLRLPEAVVEMATVA
ncbi:restriction endonuclease subunit S [Lysobacter rhizosphaerae]